MCLHPELTVIETTTETKKFRLADFFDQHWDAYAQSPKEYIAPEQYKAVAAMRVCRTGSLGVDHYACPQCGEISEVYHSCKHRFCPTCSWKDTLDWAEKMKGNLMMVPHRHVVFTLPHQLNNLIKSNKWELLDFLFKAASESVKDWMWHKYKLKPGIISVLHTFGETKDFHCHVHMILSWGGVNKNHLIEQIKGEFVNYEFIQAKFRCKFEDKLVKLFDSGQLGHRFKNRADFLGYLRMINEKNWRVHFEKPMSLPAQVICYIGRYSKRACLSEHKITNIKGGEITFRHKDYKDLDIYGKPIEKELTLNYRDFFPRLLQHVPLPYFRIVRYYGVYAARTKAVMERCYKDPVPEGVLEGKIEEETEGYEMPSKPTYCNTCKVDKLYMYTTFNYKKGGPVFMSKVSLLKIKKKHMAA
jgi:Putative transposase/Transposase zinc-binding domain